ncbi:MAG: DUF192 domain-containing protein [Phycisphaerales bacterium]|nr:DUF192 domain-containing protein [Phycisphaerales bacterium]
MKKSTMIRIGLLALVIIAMGGLAYAANRGGDGTVTQSSNTPPAKAKSGLAIEQVTLQGKVFQFEVAANVADIARGLSNRAEIAANTGMIFIFPAGNERSFWMVDCLVDMDIAYLAADGTVLSVYSMKKEAPRGEREPVADYEARLKRYLSGPGAQFAIETPAGTNEALKIKTGVKIAINRKKLLSHLTR